VCLVEGMGCKCDWFRVWGVNQKLNTNKSVLGSEHGLDRF